MHRASRATPGAALLALRRSGHHVGRCLTWRWGCTASDCPWRPTLRCGLPVFVPWRRWRARGAGSSWWTICRAACCRCCSPVEGASWTWHALTHHSQKRWRWRLRGIMLRRAAAPQAARGSDGWCAVAPGKLAVGEARRLSAQSIRTHFRARPSRARARARGSPGSARCAALCFVARAGRRSDAALKRSRLTSPEPSRSANGWPSPRQPERQRACRPLARQTPTGPQPQPCKRSSRCPPQRQRRIPRPRPAAHGMHLR